MTPEATPPNTVIVECELPESREKVWKALTVPELLAKWLMPNDIRAEVGSRFQLQPRQADASSLERPSSIECQVLEAEPNRRLRLSWREVEKGATDVQPHIVRSIVTFDLEETATGSTYLRLVHEGFEVVEMRSLAANVIQLRPVEHRTARRMRTARRVRRPQNAMVSMTSYLRRAA